MPIVRSDVCFKQSVTLVDRSIIKSDFIKKHCSVIKVIETINNKLFACLLTRSSSAVRSGVRVGACGTLGSLPRLGGKGSRGRPLHTSFREDILFVFFVFFPVTHSSSSQLSLKIVLSGEKTSLL